MSTSLIINKDGQPVILFDNKEMANEWLAKVDSSEQKTMQYKMVSFKMYGKNDYNAVFNL